MTTAISLLPNYDCVQGAQVLPDLNTGVGLQKSPRELIADLLDPPTVSKMGRPKIHARREIANAIFYVTATGCQWRHLPDTYPPWSTVHSYHVAWSRDGTWEHVCDRLSPASGMGPL